MKPPEKAYLVTEKKSGKKRLIDASAPANAIAHCARDQFQAQRLEGPALAVVMDSMELESASNRNTAAGQGELRVDGDKPDGDGSTEPSKK